MANNNNIFGLKNLPKNIVPGANVPTTNLLGLGPIDEALFLDNDSHHIQNVGKCSRVQSVKVAGKDESCKCGQQVPIQSPEYIYFLDELSPSGRAAAAVIVRILLGTGKLSESLDIGSGIQPPDVRTVKQWVQKHKGKRLAVLIDYDRTITTIEGGWLLAPSFQELLMVLNDLELPSEYSLKTFLAGLTLEGFVEYYVGGPQRMKMLQEMFDFLYENDVVSILLTNNTACPTRKPLFQQMLQVLTRGREVFIICGAEYGFDKKTAIQSQSPQFPAGSLVNLCEVVGGGKQKTRRVMKKAKKLRKQKTRTHS